MYTERDGGCGDMGLGLRGPGQEALCPAVAGHRGPVRGTDLTPSLSVSLLATDGQANSYSSCSAPTRPNDSGLALEFLGLEAA